MLDQIRSQTTTGHSKGKIMLNIRKIDHIGIRVSDKHVAMRFYEMLGFKTLVDVGFEKGHPIMMEHPSGVVLNLLGPANTNTGSNVLMDIDEKHPGITHMALRVESLDEAKALFADNGVEITGSFSFKDMNAIFVRDPDRNVIELDEYPGENPASRNDGDNDPGYDGHPA